MGEFLNKSRHGSGTKANLHQSQHSQLKADDQKSSQSKEVKSEEEGSKDSSFAKVLQGKWDSSEGGEENNQKRGHVPTIKMEEEEPIQRKGPMPLQFHAAEEEEIPVQRKGPVPPISIEEEEEQPIQRKGPIPIQFYATETEEEPVQRKGPVPPINFDQEELSQSGSSSSDKMPPLVQRKMESSFGEDFSDVNIHANSSQSKDLNAHAFAKGNDIHFAPGRYNPESQKGQELLGHELTHVVQQRQGRVQSTVQKKGVGINDDVGLEKEADEMGEKAAKGVNGGETSHSFVKVNENTKNEVSSAIQADLKKAVDIVKSYTNVDIGIGFGDTKRDLSMTTDKVGADNISWHKTGRAIDFNQALKWVIAKDPDGKDMYFRLYLLKTSDGDTIYDKSFEKDKTSFQSNPYGVNVYKKKFIDVTAILIENGFGRIKAHAGWEEKYNKMEWWHYEKRDGLNMYQALKQVYTEEQIIKGYKGMVGANKDTSCARLKREGFDDDILIKMIGQSIRIGDLELYCSVGKGKNIPNLDNDIQNVQAIFQEIGIESSNCNEEELYQIINNVYEKFYGKRMNSPVLTVGGVFHKKLGNLKSGRVLMGNLPLLESVGNKKTNLFVDVVAVKMKLNEAFSKNLISINGAPLPIDGTVSEELLMAIEEFQNKILKSSAPTGEIFKGSISHAKLGSI